MSTKCFVSYLINHLHIRDQHILSSETSSGNNSRLTLLDEGHADDGDNKNNNNVIMMFDEPIEYVWIQGVIMGISSVADDSMVQWIIDDGTGVIMILIRLQTNDYPSATTSHSEFVSQYAIGDYVLVQGSVVIGRDEETAQVMRYVEALLVSPVRDPNMESLWSMEVVEGRKKVHVLLL
jgi:RPA family protein